MSAIPRRLARRIDALSRAAHRFHRFAHHPLCDEYAGEVLRIGRKGRICRGCTSAAIGTACGATVALGASSGGFVALGAGAALFAASVAWMASTIARESATALGSAGARAGAIAATDRLKRRPKLVTRFVPALAIGFAFTQAVRTRGPWGFGLAVTILAAGAALVAAYRHRGPNRTPCATCPERRALAPCRGYAAIVHRERAFRRVAARMLTGAGV